MKASRVRSLLATLAVVVLMAACGGGTETATSKAQGFVDQMAAAQPTAADARKRAMAAGETVVNAAAAFDWAEYTYPELFPKVPAPLNFTLPYLGFVYTVRGYANGNYLGVTPANEVYGLGPFTNDELTLLGTLSQFAGQIQADACSVYPGSCDAARARKLFDWAEYAYAVLFPKGPQGADVVIDGVGYVERAYPNGNALRLLKGSADPLVYGFGPFAGNVLMALGKWSDFAGLVHAAACQVYPGSCGEPAPTPTPAPGGLYVGWLEEDPQNNPEDPTVGALFLRVPAGDGAYTGFMPFGYVGCSPGVDIGSTSGTRSGNSLAGTWAGHLDGTSVGGSFAAEAPAGSTPARFDGSFTNANGKQAISVGACNYFMAAQGRFRVFDGPASEPAGVALNFSASSTAPVISWTGVPAGATTALRVFDQACLEGPSPSAACYLGEAFSTGSSLAYPAAFSGGQPLAVGGHYVVVLTAQTATTGVGAGIAAFASARFSPAVAGGGE